MYIAFAYIASYQYILQLAFSRPSFAMSGIIVPKPGKVKTSPFPLS